MHHCCNQNLFSRRRLPIRAGFSLNRAQPPTTCLPAFQGLSLALVVLLAWAPSVYAQLPAASADQIELRIVSGAGAEFQPGTQQKQRLVMQVVNQDEHPLAGVAVTFQLPDEGPSGLFSNGQRSMVAFTNEEGEAAITGVKWNTTSGAVSIRVTAVKGMAHAGTLLPVRLTAGSAKLPPPATAAASPQMTTDTGARSGAGGYARPAASVDAQPGTLRTESASSPTAAAGERPAVTISGAPQGRSGPSSKKWLVIALVAAGAGAGVAIALLKKSGSSSSSTTSSNPLSIGSPAISVGQP
jgi:hypothetical protein